MGPIYVNPARLSTRINGRNTISRHRSKSFEILNKCNNHNVLHIVFEASVIFHNMSTRGVLATPMDRILAWSTGLCNSHDNALVAEGAGMLSITIFLSLVSKYSKSELLKITFILDNDDLINQYKAPQETTRPKISD